MKNLLTLFMTGTPQSNYYCLLIKYYEELNKRTIYYFLFILPILKIAKFILYKQILGFKTKFQHYKYNITCIKALSTLLTS